jgi:hypothetical protein
MLRIFLVRGYSNSPGVAASATLHFLSAQSVHSFGDAAKYFSLWPPHLRFEDPLLCFQYYLSLTKLHEMFAEESYA